MYFYTFRNKLPVPLTVGAFFFFRYKTTITFVFSDIQNNEGLDKAYQLQPSVSANNPTSTLIILDITKASSNNCLQAAESKLNACCEGIRE